MPDSFGKQLFDSFLPDAILVGCSIDMSGEYRGIDEVLIAVARTRSIHSVQLVVSEFKPGLEQRVESAGTQNHDEGHGRNPVACISRRAGSK